MSKLITVFILVVFLVLPNIIFAQDPGQWFVGIVNNFLSIVVWPVFVGLIVIMFMWAGILFLLNKTDDARKALLWAFVGLFVGLLAFASVPTIKILIPTPDKQCGDTYPQCNGVCPQGQFCAVEPGGMEEACHCMQQ